MESKGYIPVRINKKSYIFVGFTLNKKNRYKRIDLEEINNLC